MRVPRELLEKYKDESTAAALEVLAHIYQTLLSAPEFVLLDGSKAKVESFVAPGVDDQGEVQCGFDVRLENGSHLEFTVQNTGWGKSVIGKGKGPRSPAGHGR